jgi:transcriptional regulator with XRE-family HTH domain
MHTSQIEPKGIGLFRELLAITTRRMQAHSTAQDMLKAFTAGISAADADDEDEFRAFLLLATSSLGLSQIALAERLMVTRVTLQRWLSGKSTPPRYSRRGLLAEISELAFETIDEIYRHTLDHPGAPFGNVDTPSDTIKLVAISDEPALDCTRPTLRA